MLILPTVEFPPVTPFIFQTTFVFAVNCRVWRIFTLALVGETFTVIDGAVTAMLTAFDTWPPGFVTVMGIHYAGSAPDGCNRYSLVTAAFSSWFRNNAMRPEISS